MVVESLIRYGHQRERSIVKYHQRYSTCTQYTNTWVYNHIGTCLSDLYREVVLLKGGLITE